MENINIINREALNDKIFNILYDSKLCWAVDKKPLVTVEGHPTESFGMFRSDNNKWLGTVGPKYTPYQNAQLAEHFVTSCEQLGITEIRGGSLGTGGKVYLQGAIPEAKVGTDTIKRWITGLNSHNGSSSIAFGAQSTVVICGNTFYRAYRYKGMEKFRHTATVDSRVGVFVQDLNNVIQQELGLIETYKKLAEVPIQEKHIVSLFTKLFGVDLSKPIDKEEISTRKENQVTSVSQAIRKNGFDVHGQTLWGLFQGITYSTNYILTKPERKQEYLMTGGGYELSNLCFDTLMEEIGENVMTGQLSLS